MISDSVISVPTGDCLGRQPVLASPKLLVACARVRQHRIFCRVVVRLSLLLLLLLLLLLFWSVFAVAFVVDGYGLLPSNYEA